MRRLRLQQLALLPIIALPCATFAAVSLAAWTHHPTSSSSSFLPPVVVDAGGTTSTTTNTQPGSFTSTGAYEFNGANPTFSIVTMNPSRTAVTTTTITKNADGSTTTTTSTKTVATGSATTTTTLTNPPVNKVVDVMGDFQVVTINPSTTANGVTTTTLTIVVYPYYGGPGSIYPPISTTIETYSVAATIPVASTAASTSATALPEPATPAPRGVVIAQAPANAPAIVQAASEKAQAAIEACGLQSPPCIADALDAYAADLEKLAPQLPPRLRTLPAIIRAAAQKVRVARTKAEAVKAVTSAIAQVRKTIMLLRADDPIARTAGAREGAFVVETLQVASDKLEKASGL